MRTKNKNETAEAITMLMEWLKYEKETGQLYWRKSPHPRINAGYPAGAPSGGRYPQVVVRGMRFRAHRIVFAMHHGEWPEIVDHIDGDTHNNMIENLRAASNKENCRNSRVNKNNRSGYKGATFHTQRGRWQSRIRVDGKLISLGMYDTAEDAHKAYVAGSIRYFGEFSKYYRREA